MSEKRTNTKYIFWLLILMIVLMAACTVGIYRLDRAKRIRRMEERRVENTKLLEETGSQIEELVKLEDVDAIQVFIDETMVQVDSSDSISARTITNVDVRPEEMTEKSSFVDDAPVIYTEVELAMLEEDEGDLSSEEDAEYLPSEEDVAYLPSEEGEAYPVAEDETESEEEHTEFVSVGNESTAMSANASEASTVSGEEPGEVSGAETDRKDEDPELQAVPELRDYDNQRYSVSGNGVYDASGNCYLTVSGNYPWETGLVFEDGVSANSTGSLLDEKHLAERAAVVKNTLMPLEKRKESMTSLEETLQYAQADLEVIEGKKLDYSGLKITCIGDSITQAINLDSLDDYQQFSYPTKLGQALGCDNIVNLGIGGSSIGRYWADAFVDRYTEIPEDTDIIIVMGGTNDGFCVSQKEFGSLDKRARDTFCGDLDEMMRGLKTRYPNAHIIFATPLPNILHDKLRTERDYLLPQYQFVDAIIDLSLEYGFDLIDLYDSNLLDSHEADIISLYVPDGVHPNIPGYEILGNHFAAEIIKRYESGLEYQISAIEDQTEKAEIVLGIAPGDEPKDASEKDSEKDLDKDSEKDSEKDLEKDSEKESEKDSEE